MDGSVTDLANIDNVPLWMAFVFTFAPLVVTGFISYLIKIRMDDKFEETATNVLANLASHYELLKKKELLLESELKLQRTERASDLSMQREERKLELKTQQVEFLSASADYRQISARDKSDRVMFREALDDLAYRLNYHIDLKLPQAAKQVDQSLEDEEDVNEDDHPETPEVQKSSADRQTENTYQFDAFASGVQNWDGTVEGLHDNPTELPIHHRAAFSVLRFVAIYGLLIEVTVDRQTSRAHTAFLDRLRRVVPNAVRSNNKRSYPGDPIVKSDYFEMITDFLIMPAENGRPARPLHWVEFKKKCLQEPVLLDAFKDTCNVFGALANQDLSRGYRNLYKARMALLLLQALDANNGYLSTMSQQAQLGTWSADGFEISETDLLDNDEGLTLVSRLKLEIFVMYQFKWQLDLSRKNSRFVQPNWIVPNRRDEVRSLIDAIPDDY